MKLPETIAALGAALDADIPVFLWGAPGIGKSAAPAAVAKARAAACFDIRLSMFDPVDLRGLPAIVDGRTVWLRPGIWPVDETAESILFFDEMDRASPAVLSAAMQIVLDRRIGEHALPSTVRIVAAGNGKTDRTGTNRMPSALANRFCHIDVEPDAAAWATWAAGAGIDPALVAFIRFRPALLHASTMADAGMPEGDGRAYPSPRAWAAINRVMNQPDMIRHALAKGLVGEGPAAEFEGFVRIMRGLPNLDSVLADPAGAMVPQDPATRYAMAAALARKATDSNFAAVLAYVARLGREFEVMAAVDATKRAPALIESAPYVAWAVRNAAVLA